MRRTLPHLLAVAAVGLAVSGICLPETVAQERGKSKQSVPAKDDASRSNPREKRAAAKSPAFSRQREAAALSFVQEHHPELSDLLAQLKRQDRPQYERAIRDLFRTSERLANERERDEERWNINLRTWKLQSRIRLLAARLAMDPEDEELLAALREALADQLDARLERLRLDRRRMVQRINRLDAAIERAEKSKEKNVEDSVQKLLQSVTRRRDETKKSSRRSEVGSRSDKRDD